MKKNLYGLVYLLIGYIIFLFPHHTFAKNEKEKVLILIVSDEKLGRFGEFWEEVSLRARARLYGYGKVIVVRGNDATNKTKLNDAAKKADRTGKVVDVVIFSHGSADGAKTRGGLLTADLLGEGLSPIRNKLRLIYTSSCDAGAGGYLNEIKYKTGAQVVTGHQGTNNVPLTYPFKFLRYFNKGMSAEDAAQRAYQASINNKNPFTRFIIQPLINKFTKSQSDWKVAAMPVIVGNKSIAGSMINLNSYQIATRGLASESYLENDRFDRTVGYRDFSEALAE